MLIAVREYLLDGFRCTDTLTRTGPQTFRLTLESDDLREVTEMESLDVYEANRWLSECPEQLTLCLWRRLCTDTALPPIVLH